MMKAVYHSLEVIGLSHDGRGIAKLSDEHDTEATLSQSGKSCFIEGAVPGDTITLKIVDQQDQFAEGKLLKIEQPSSDRSEPFCRYFDECGGCQLQHLNIDAQRHWKAENFFNQLKKAVDTSECEFTAPLKSADKAYRRRARMALEIDKRTKQPRFGFRKSHSNELIDIETCPVLSDALNDAIHMERDQLLQQASRATKEYTLVEADNGVFGLKETSDKPYYRLQLAGEKTLLLTFPQDGFIQVNKEINNKMIEQVLEWLSPSPEEKVLDLFCGVGNFTLPLAQKAGQVIGIEGLEELVETARHNASDNQLNNLDFFQANLFKDISGLQWFRKQQYHSILLDPGRLGAFELSKQLGELQAQQVVYVSCNASTLIRDIKELQKQGYRLKKACFMDMFAHTTHAEVMVLLEKVKKQTKQRDKRIASKKKLFKF